MQGTQNTTLKKKKKVAEFTLNDIKMYDKATVTQTILKSRDITLPTKVCLVKAMVFPVVMYGYESWDCEEG